MEIEVKEQTFRSEGRGVNLDDDMVRVTIDVKRTHWHTIKAFLKKHDLKFIVKK